VSRISEESALPHDRERERETNRRFLLVGLIPHVVYYGKVTGELGRIIYQNRGMQPP
jgi:hypothetical protein